MRITKFVHSCLLVEDQGKAVLIDPGNYSWESGLVNLDKLPQLDYMLITHEHADHFHLPFVKAVMAKQPQINILTTQPVAEVLKPAGIKAATKSQGPVDIWQVAHEALPWQMPVPLNIGLTVFEQLTNPGDSFQLTKTRRILALPIVAPWGAFKQAFDLIMKLKPEVVIPIHDAALTDDARENFFYARSHDFFKSQHINFVPIVSGQPVEI
ncbi:MBL fold metallo-hydrolase [Candidatus Microgenomates bacterium]|nr:MBL fold metallo-hydrolase [Candidatus Microgenomates bacterium]